MTQELVDVFDAPPPDAHLAERPVPYNRDAEKAVLGAMMLDPSVVTEVTVILEARDFYIPRHELIFDAIRAAAERLEPTDVIAVEDRLQRLGALNRSGGPSYLHEIVQSVVTTANATYYADLVREQATLRRLGEAGTRIVQMSLQPGEGDVGDIILRAGAEIEKARGTVVEGTLDRHSWDVHDLSEIVLHGDTPQIPTVLERVDGFCLLYPGAFHSLAAEPSSGKSWVAILACAQELKAGAHATYVDWEDRPGRVVARLMALGVKPQTILDRFHYIRPTRPLDPMGRALLDERAASSSILILDGVTEGMTLHGMDIDSQADAARFIHLFPKHLADLGPAVLQIDHLPKTTDPHNRFAIGAQHKLAGLDGAAYMMKVLEPFGRGKRGRAKITVSKDREGTVDEKAVGRTIAELVIDSTGPDLYVALDCPHGAPLSEDGGFRPTVLMERVSRFVESSPAPVSGRQIEAGVSGNGKSIRDAIRILNAEGFLESRSGARGAVLYASLSSYREGTPTEGEHHS